MANFKGANIEQDFMFVDEDGNPIESTGENLIYVDEAGREIPAEKASRMLESGEYIDTRVLYEDKSKKKAFNNMAGEARIRDQIRDEIVAKAYQLSLVKDPNAQARNRAEEQAFLKINKVKYDDMPPQSNQQLPPTQPRNQPLQQQQQQQPPTASRVNSQQRQRDEQARQRRDEQARHRPDEHGRLKSPMQQQQQQQQSRLRPDDRARLDEQMRQQQNQFARNRSRSTEQSYAQQQAQMRSRNATPITPMRLERSNSRSSNNRNKENFMNQQQHQQQQQQQQRSGEQGKTKEDQMLHLLKSQLLKKQQELMPAHSQVEKPSKPHQPLRRDNSKILVNKNATYY